MFQKKKNAKKITEMLYDVFRKFAAKKYKNFIDIRGSMEMYKLIQ